MLTRKALFPLLLTVLHLAFVSGPVAFAQESDSTEAETVVVEEAPAGESENAPIDYADIKWDMGYTINTLIMFVCAVLVLFMQAGFAMVEVGLNSQKNTINILFKNVMDLSLGIVLYLFVGYGLMYGGDTEGSPWFGWSGSMVARDAQMADDGTWATPPTDSDGAPYASNAADFMFQVAFAATAATIVSGAVAGRMKFIAYLCYSIILTGLIYPISGYWKWGGGQLDQWGFQDFAGSVVVHAVGGFAGLAGAIALGPRIGRYTAEGKSVPMPGHNITYAALGVFILWIGWYGFNPGSQLTYDGAVQAEATTYIALTTTLSAAAGAILAMVCSWGKFGKPDITMALNGALAGLVGITANCDRVSEMEALIIGAVAGFLVFAGILALDKLKIDDPVGAFPVHGLCGIWGGLATGIFGDIPDGIASQGEFFFVQLKSTAIICAWAFVTMMVVFYVLKAIGMLRVSPEEEQRGLDITEHGMEAYTLS
ncbi:MAG: ammonium transporter [Planctomycetaceae bacterium]|nr:ammonium transporter [Planctomycetaceae bacterium]